MVYLIVILTLFLSSKVYCEEKVFNLMGTYAIVEIDGELEYEVYRFLKNLEDKLSDYIKDSEISAINKFAGIKPVKVSPETFEVIKKSVEISELTDGAFDITVGAITIRYKRDKEIDLKQAKKLVNYKDIVLDEKNMTVFLKKKGMAIDLGGIGKGYAIQKAYEFIKKDKGFIAIAGDLKSWGHERNIGIFNPITKKILTEGIAKKDICVSTSGNYFQKHIIGQKTDLLQVSVVYNECTFTDALSTAIFAMDKNKREKFLKNAKFGYLLVFENGNIEFNRNFLDFFEEIKFFPF